MKICPQCQTSYADDVDFCSLDGMKLRAERVAQRDPMIGRVLDGRWIIDSKIGEGGMGAVYLGRQRSVNRRVAIKTLRAELTDTDEFVDRFFREAQIATTINHPNCVTILDFGQDAEDGLLFLAMEYLEGMPLSDRMVVGEALSLHQALTITDEVAAALEAAHAHGIVHRDLKPDNIFLQQTASSEAHCKLLDFGIAKDSNASTQYTRTGQIFGTPDYMSPEQCGGSELDGRSDLYSLGCILYEMICGQPPFPNANSMATLVAHVTEKPRPPSALDASIPEPLEQLVLRLLSKAPEQRPADAATLRQELTALRGALHTPALAAASSRSALPPASHGESATADTLAGELQAPDRPHTEPPSLREPTAEQYAASADLLIADPPPRRYGLKIAAALILTLSLSAAAILILLVQSDDSPRRSSPSVPEAVASSPPVVAPSAPAEPSARPATTNADADGLAQDPPTPPPIEKRASERPPSTQRDVAQHEIEPNAPRKAPRTTRPKPKPKPKPKPRRDVSTKEPTPSSPETETIEKEPATPRQQREPLEERVPKKIKRLEREVMDKSEKIVDELFN